MKQPGQLLALVPCLIEGTNALEQVFPHRRSALVAVLGEPSEGASTDAIQVDGDVVAHVEGPWDRVETNSPHSLHGALSPEQAAPREELPEHDAKSEHIDAMVELAAIKLLRRHVGDLSFDHAGLRLCVLKVRLGDAKVDEFYVPVIAQEDVVRAHVAVDDVERRTARVGVCMGCV